MSVDTLFEGLKNILEIMNNLVPWGLEVESNFWNLTFRGICSFVATNNELIFTDQVRDINEKPNLGFNITKNFLLYLLEDGFKIEFKQTYRGSLVDFTLMIICEGHCLKIKVYDIDYDVAKEALEKITKEIYKIRGVRESREGD